MVLNNNYSKIVHYNIMNYNWNVDTRALRFTRGNLKVIADWTNFFKEGT